MSEFFNTITGFKKEQYLSESKEKNYLDETNYKDVDFCFGSNKNINKEDKFEKNS